MELGKLSASLTNIDQTFKGIAHTIENQRYTHCEQIYQAALFMERGVDKFEAMVDLAKTSLDSKRNVDLIESMKDIQKIFKKMIDDYHVDKPYIQAFLQNYSADRHIEMKSLKYIKRELK